MPDIMVEVAGSWLGERRGPFLQVVHRAVAGSLGTPEDEPVARLVEHPVDAFLRPQGVGERFTRIEICLFRGRSLEAKRRLYRALVDALAAHDVAPGDVKIVLVEVTSEDVGLRGGQAACDVDLGYAIQV